MFDLKKKTVVHDIEPVVKTDDAGTGLANESDRLEPTLNIDPPEPIEPVVQSVGVGWFPGVKASTPTGVAPVTAQPMAGQPLPDNPPAMPTGAGPVVPELVQPSAGQPVDDPDKQAPRKQPAAPFEMPQSEIPRQAEAESARLDEPPVHAESGQTAPEVTVIDAPPDQAAGNGGTGDQHQGKQNIPQFGLPVDTRSSSPKIGSILVANGKMTEPQVQQVLSQQEAEPGLRFGELSVRNRFASQKDVDDALASQFGFSSNSQSSINLAPEIVVAHNPFSPFSEALRGLRSQLMLRWFDGSPQQGALAMTSVDRADGKSFICANLGVVFSQLGEKTLIIDADLRNSTQHSKFGVQNRMGLSGLLSGRAGVEEILAVPGLNNLAVLPAGPLPPNPQELLGREEFSQFLAAMAGTFDVILIDTPSAQQASDAQVVAQRARAAVIVGRKDKTKSSEIAQLGAVMTSSGVKLLGATLNSY